MREEILNKIREMASANGGRPPGSRAFERETGIRTSAWLGVYWARWGDALKEAGFAPNAFQSSLPETFILEKIAKACRHYGHLPTSAELRMFAARDDNFPSHSVISSRLPKVKLIQRLREWTSSNEEYADVTAMLPEHKALESGARARTPDGYVYLIASGAHYKIGRSDELERRVKEIRTALPEAAKLVHTIRTDDPPGIEAYWHKRFADRRANGEWFKLSHADVAAFKRRTYQ
ncbi:MAG: GIY-YIG nuclease family protein [Alphaproteobacteria bacterium]|nr:GIY-YIG nuclease family protein [Alphaproteobacteria bacterium]